MLYGFFYINMDVPTPWGIYFQDSATPPSKWSGKSLLYVVGIKLSNSGKPLELQVPSHSRKTVGGWTNHSCMVTSLKASEKNVGNRGSKSVIGESITVKEQRVNGSWCGCASYPYLRCTLMGFERNYQVKILTTQLVNKRSYSTSFINDARDSNNQGLIIDPGHPRRGCHGSSPLLRRGADPNFLTGFTDAEGSFVLSITKSNTVRSGWIIKPRFRLRLHLQKKDLFILEAIQKFLGVGKVYVQGTNSAVEYRVFSIKELGVVLDHFDKFPLISNKYGDYSLFKQAYLLLVNQEHLTPEGLRKVISIKASINKGLSEPLKEAFPDVTPAARPVRENISIYDPQWLAGFTSGEGSFMVKVRKPNGNRRAVIELVFQINQHIQDKQLMAYIAQYLGCGKIYKHSMNAVMYSVSKTSDLTEIIIPFFFKYPILGIKALDFKDFYSVFVLIKSKAHYTKEGLDQIFHIKANMNTGRVDY